MIAERKILKRGCELSFDENRWTSFETRIEKKYQVYPSLN